MIPDTVRLLVVELVVAPRGCLLLHERGPCFLAIGRLARSSW
jgi:hypothetical protein